MREVWGICPHGGFHVAIFGACWYCGEKVPQEDLFEFRRPATSTFGWTLTRSDFDRLRKRREPPKNQTQLHS